MKGIVFTEFLEFVEENFSPELVDDIIDASDLSTGGAYTTIATYDHQEMIRLVSAMSRVTDMPVAALIKDFGHHLFGRLAAGHPQFLSGVDSTFSLLKLLEDYIHVEVRKLYEDTELPTLEYTMLSPEQMELIYHSKRPFGDLAEGLIRGCIDHYGESISIEREQLEKGEGTTIRFLLTRSE